MASVDALVIGGGFFGCEIAVELRRLGFARVMLCEREAGLLRRASYVNQARVHNGYHYPRSLSTAERSRANFERFVADYGFAVRTDMVKLYAIAATSRVNAGQFASFCGKIGVPCREAPATLARLFDPDLIEAAFLTRELAFDAVALARSAAQRLADAACRCAAGDAGEGRAHRRRRRGRSASPCPARPSRPGLSSIAPMRRSTMSASR